MSDTFTEETFDSLSSYWADPSQHLRWASVFILPTWLKAWWQEFSAGAELYLGSVRQGEKIIGIAPLLVREGKAAFIGSSELCDYLDFVVAPGMEKDFFNVLLDDLKKKGIYYLDLGCLRSDSTVLTNLVSIARNRQYEVLCPKEEVAVEVDLPATWEEYLVALSTKQRHEVRRKLRRLEEAARVEYHCPRVDHEVKDLTDIFLRLFSLSRDKKTSFMTAKMEAFFRSLAKAMAEMGLLRFGILKLDTMPVAMTMGFDYQDSMYIYNSAYDLQYNSLSVGLLCKVLCLKQSIEEGKKRFDLLKGNERYKYHLGGKDVPLYRCQITIR